MSIEDDLSEGLEKAKKPFERKVAMSMAIIAAALAIVSVLGHILTTDELLAQQKASDRWSYYQAKSIRRYESDIARDLLIAAGKPAEKYSANLDRYEKDAEEIQNEAKKLEDESGIRGRQALRLHFGEVFLEIGIVFASLAILTQRRFIWLGSIVIAFVGSAIALTTLTIVK